MRPYAHTLIRPYAHIRSSDDAVLGHKLCVLRLHVLEHVLDGHVVCVRHEHLLEVALREPALLQERLLHFLAQLHLAHLEGLQVRLRPGYAALVDELGAVVVSGLQHVLAQLLHQPHHLVHAHIRQRAPVRTRILLIIYIPPELSVNRPDRLADLGQLFVPLFHVEGARLLQLVRVVVTVPVQHRVLYLLEVGVEVRQDELLHQRLLVDLLPPLLDLLLDVLRGVHQPRS
mmetsp:Transcript_34342/g.75702  ORF Transcript_34342/g.75702 Transcript_34342/m.75702 type:complete len:230 (-) Transcript_34342:41-730(-)